MIRRMILMILQQDRDRILLTKQIILRLMQPLMLVRSSSSS